MTCIACLCKKQPDLYSTSAAVLSTLHTVSDNDVGCHRSNMCVMCSTSVPASFQYLLYDHIPTFLYIFMKCLLLVCMLFSCFCTPQISVSVFCNWILTVSHSSASVHYWPCPVLSAKETRSIKVGNACVRALLRRKRCVRRRLAKGVLFFATRVRPRRVAVAGHVIKVKLTRRVNKLASMEKRPFLVHRQCGDDGG